MDKYMDYIKYGDILISPSLHYKEDYILRCCECNNYYTIFEELLTHLTTHHNNDLVQENIDTDVKAHGSQEGDMVFGENDPLIMQTSYLNVFKVEMEDPSSQAHEREKFIEKENCVDSDNDGSESSVNREHKYNIEEYDTGESLDDSNRVEENDKDKLFSCNECGSKLKTRKGLRRHTKLHLRDIQEFKCHYCGTAFKTLGAMNNHLKKHGENETAETSASDNDNDIDDWPPHNITRTENAAEGVEKCEEYKSIISQAMDDHEEKPHVCTQCGSRLKTRKSLKRHLRIHLRQPIENNPETKITTKYECEFCKKLFQQSSSLKDHLRTHTGEQPYLCSECGKAFKSLSNMKQHLLRHGTDRPYECPDCPKKFPCLSDLASHKAVHTKNKSHVCDICGSGFVKPYLLKKHKMYHNGEKNHKCDYCDMRFVLADHCRRHMRTHTGEKPYKCKYCDRGFAQSNDLIKHLRGHLGDNVYRCNLCPQGFRLQGDLRTHFNTHKNDNEETKLENLQALKEDELRIQMKFGLVKQQQIKK